jgi:hypothetical protein
MLNNLRKRLLPVRTYTSTNSLVFSLTLINAGIRITQDFKDGVDGAVKIAVDVLGIVASTTQNVPYLGIISGALTEFIKIKDVFRAKSD